MKPIRLNNTFQLRKNPLKRSPHILDVAIGSGCGNCCCDGNSIGDRHNKLFCYVINTLLMTNGKHSHNNNSNNDDNKSSSNKCAKNTNTQQFHT